jgi:hypothetical protein
VLLLNLLHHEVLLLSKLVCILGILLDHVLLLAHLMEHILVSILHDPVDDILPMLIILGIRQLLMPLSHLLSNLLYPLVEYLLSLIVNLLLIMVLDLWSAFKEFHSLMTHLKLLIHHQRLSSLYKTLLADDWMFNSCKGILVVL